MDPDLVIGGVCSALIVVVLAGAVPYFRRFPSHARLPREPKPPRDRIDAAPRLTIAHATPGVAARIVGRVTALADGPLLQAPLTGRPCIAWQVLVLSGSQQPTDDSTYEPEINWGVEHTNESGGAIELRDDSGMATVQLAGALWALPAESAQLKFELDLTAATRAYLERIQMTWSGYMKPLLRLDERILEADARVLLFAANRAPPASAPTGGYRDAPAAALFATSVECPLVILPAPAE